MKRLLTLFLLLSALPFASVLGQITVYSWGLAPGTGSSQAYSPTKIGADGAWAAFETGSNMCGGIKTDGSLWTCGANFDGQLGNGTTTLNYTLTQVGTEKNWAAISAGTAYFLALKKDGTLWAWGDNSYGQLGDGTQSDRLVPTKIGTATDWVAVKTGQSNSMALKQDGTLYIWGDNSFGQLGKGTSGSTPALVPTKLNNDTDWASMACGMAHAVAIKKNGELWAWGTNIYGNFGDGTTTNSFVPKRIGTAQDWQAVSLTAQHVLALKTNGDLYSWGVNSKGQLGDGGTSNRSSPYFVGSNYNTIAAGFENSSATKKDGTLYTWGADNMGTLANGNSTYSSTAYRNTPGQITVGTVKFSGTKYYYVSGHAWVVTGATVLSMASTGPLVTNASSVSYTVTFDTPVTGLTTSNFDLDPASTATGASVASVTAVAGNTQWTVVVNTPSATGTVKLRMNNATGASLNVLNLPYSSTNVYTLDKTAPELSSIIRNTPASALTKATSVIYKVKFNESVTGVDATDFNTMVSGTTPGTITVANGSDASEYLVTVPVTGNGTLQLKLNTTGTGITDLGSNALSSTLPDGEVYTIDQTAPTSVSLSRYNPTGGITNSTSLVYKLTFSEDVSGVDATDFSVTKASTVTAGALTVSAGATAAEYFITIPSVSGHGSYYITLNWSNGIADMAGNALPAGISSQTYMIDQTPPSMISITRLGPSQQNTNSSNVIFRIKFSESISSVNLDAFTAVTDGTLIAGTFVLSGISNTEYGISVPVTGSGTIRLDLKPGTTGMVDDAGNPLPGGYTGNETFIVDRDQPVVTSIARYNPTANLTNISPVIYKVTFSENVTGVDAADFTAMVGTGLTAGALSVSNGDNAAEYLVSVPVTGNGNLLLGLNGSGTGIVDAFGNGISGVFVLGDSYVVDQTAPSVSSIIRKTPSAQNTNSTSVTYTVTFSEAVSGVDAADFTATAVSGTLSKGILSINAVSALVYNITVPSISGNGTLRLDLNASGTGISDVAGNAIAAGFNSGSTYVIDQTLPAVSSIVRKMPAAQNANAASVTYTVTFSEAVSGVDATDFTATTVSGSITKGTLTAAAVSSSVYDITVPSISGNGTLRLDLNASGTGISDAAGNAVSGGYTTGDTYLIDQILPAVNSIVRKTPSVQNTNATSVTYTVTFSEAVSGVDAADFTATTVSGTLSKGTLTATAVSSSVYDITVPAISGNGTLRLDLNASGTGISDAAGNTIAAGFTTGNTYLIDQSLPAVSSIVRKTPSAQNTNATSVIYTVTFSEAVTGVDATDFTATTASGTVNKGTLSMTSVSASVYDITVPAISGNGTLRLDLNPSGTGISDAAGNIIAAGFTSGETYLIDQTLPAVTSIARKTPSAQNTNATSVTYTVAFSESVSGVDATDFTATTASGTVNKGTLSVATVSSSVYDITVPSISGNGTLRLDLNASGTGISDVAGNAIAAGFTTGETYLIDQTLPAVTSIVRKTPSAQNTNSTSVIYTVTFSEPVSGVDADDFTATTVSGTLSKGTLTATAVSSSVYDITVPAIIGNGTLRLDLNASGTGISDVAGNIIAAGFTTGDTYLIDQALPVVSSIVRKTPSAQNTNSTSVIYTVTFSEPVSGVDAADFTATTVSGTLNKGALGINAVSSSVYDIVVPSINGNGTLRLDLNASGTGISDAAGNAIAAGFNTGNTYLIDQTLPVVSSIVRKTPSAQNTNAASVTYTVTFSEAVSGVDATDFTATNVSGTLSKGTLSISAASSSVYDVTVPTISGNGTLRLDLNASGTGISDAADNIIAAGFTSGDTYLVDQTLPIVSSIARKTPSAQNTNATSVTYTITFSEAVSGVDATDFTATTVSGSITKGTLTATAVSSSVYDITVPSISGNGTLRLDLNASGTGISDAAGNVVSGGYTTGSTYLIDQTLPAVSSIVRKTPSVQNTNATSVIYTVTFSEPVSGVDAADFTATTVSGTLSKGTLTATAVSSSVYDITVPSISGNGTLRLDLNASGTGISDAAGNAIAAGFNTGNTYLIDQTLPVVSSIVRKTPSAQNTNATSVIYTVTFSEAVTGVDVTDFAATTVSGTLSKGTLSINAVSSSVYDITVPAISGNGTLRLDLKNSGTGIVDVAGNAIPAGFTAGNTYLVDQTLPAVTGIVRKTPSAQNTNATSVTYTVTFSEGVSGVDAADFTATTVSGTLSKGTLNINAVSSSVYDVTVPAISGDGILRLDVNASGTGIIDVSGNAVSGGYTAGDTYLVDQTLPLVSSIVRKTPSAQNTNTTSVIYTVTFSEAVSGVDATDFTATTVSGTLSQGTPGINAVSSSVYDITVPSISGNGTLRLDLNASGTGITDGSGNVITAAFSTGELYTIDQAKPTISIIRIASDNTNPELAKQGDMVTVSFQVSEELDLNASGAYQIQIGSQQATVEADAVNTTPEAFWYKASAVMNASEAADGNGNIKIGITGYRDLVGNTGDAKTSTTDASKVMLDTEAPDKPVTPDAPGNGGHVNTTTPTIKGVTEPNATVEILVDGVKVG
ncbi:RCC1 domain-containing protein, partial [Pararcticibacter amylolyticus]